METDGSPWSLISRPPFTLPRREREREEGRRKEKTRVERSEKRRREGKNEDSARKVWRRKKRATPRHRRFIPEATLEMCSRKSSRGAPAHKPCTHARVRAHTEARETHVRLDSCGIGGGAFSRPRLVVQNASSWTRVVSSDFLVSGEKPLYLSRAAGPSSTKQIAESLCTSVSMLLSKKTRIPLLSFYP